MVETIILSMDGSVEKKSFESRDKAEIHLVNFLREKELGGSKAFSIIEEKNTFTYAIIDQNELKILDADSFFALLNKPISIKNMDTTESKEFSILKSLVLSEQWPSAVFKVQIADENSEKDKEERAEGICDILLPPLNGKKVLDFGCGEGHIAKHAATEATISVGYDIDKSPKSQLRWEEKEENLLLTTDFEKVSSEGPYDVILIYDVLDHTKNAMSEILLRAKSVLSNEGRIYLRCHPWCGRHGGHAYRKINKAFVHIVFSEEELRAFGLELEPNQKVTFPLLTYNKAIEDAGLVKDSEHEIDTQEVEPFFSENPLVKARILKAFGAEEWSEGKPSFQMSQCFVDYVLKK